MFDRIAIRSLGAKLAVGAALLASLSVAACGSGSSSSGGASGSCPNTTALTGAGSTFVNPLFSKAWPAYAQAKCNVQVSYNSVGSGAGITQFTAQTVDFGATDSPMTDQQLAASPNGPVLHLPMTIGAVAISFNLSEVPATTHIQLAGATIANIYLGKIAFWDDAAIMANNPGASLPHKGIIPVHRSDGSGTTGIFTHYLSAISPDWQTQVGAATTVNWPSAGGAAVGAKGNEGVATQVKSTEGAIGYNELAYVLSNTIQYAAVQSHDGAYLLPSLETAKAAANSATNIPDDLRFFFVNAPGANSYPITGFTWAIVYQTQKDADKGQAIANAMWWMTHDGQQYATPLNYVPLPSAIVTKDEAKIKAMTCGGGACYKGLFG